MSDEIQPTTVAAGHLGFSEELRDQIRERLLGLLDAATRRLERAEADVGDEPVDTAEFLESTEAIRVALVKLDAGYYGVCETCEQAIPYERLDALPSVRTCVRCVPGPRSLLG